MLPTRQQAETLLLDAEALNPGPWAAHSRYVAQAAQLIAVYSIRPSTRSERSCWGCCTT